MKRLLGLTICIILFASTYIPAMSQQTGNIPLSLTVPLGNNDLPLTLAQTSNINIASENTTLAYRLDYSSLLSYTIPLTLTVSWQAATGSANPTYIVDYLPGSATNAYNNTPAVIDPLNHTITWSIPSFPTGISTQNVSFSLRTNTNYTGSDLLSFIVSAKATSNNTSTDPVNLAQYYRYSNPTPSPTPTSAQAPTPTPASQTGMSSSPQAPPTKNPQTTPSPTQNPRQTDNPFSAIEINSITQNSTSIAIALKKPSSLKVRYGTSPYNLNKLIASDLASEHLISFTDLTPNTIYYFRVEANNLTSDLYTFTTASESMPPLPEITKISLTADNTLLIAQSISGLSAYMITEKTPFEVRLELKEEIRQLSIILKGEGQKIQVPLSEISNGVHNASFPGELKIGTYTLYVHLYTKSGSLTDIPLAYLKIVPPLTVFNKQNHKPLEGARVLLMHQNPRTGEYTQLSPQTFSLNNPLYTKPDGSVRINLLYGSYKVRVSQIGYDTIEQNFTLDYAQREQYPLLYLTPNFSLLNTVSFYLDTAKDFLTSSTSYASEVGLSSRLFALVSFLSVCFLVIVTLLSLCKRFNIPLSALPAYILSHLPRQHIAKGTISGKILASDSGLPLKDAIVYLIDTRRNRILSHTQTNLLGEFSLPRLNISEFKLQVKKRHFLSTITAPKDEITLLKDESQRFFDTTIYLCQTIFGLLFETLLVLSLILEVFFARHFGWIETLPYLSITIATLLLWLFMIRRTRPRQSPGGNSPLDPSSSD